MTKHLCSQCHITRTIKPFVKCCRCDFMSYLSKISPIIRIKLSNKNYYVNSSLYPKKCDICEQDDEIDYIKPFSCKCNINVCWKCSFENKKCPICNASRYQEITSNDLIKFAIIMCRFNEHNHNYIEKILKKYLKNLYENYKMSGNVTLRSFYSSNEAIAIAIKYMIDNDLYSNYAQRHMFLGFTNDINFSEYFNKYGISHQFTDDIANANIQIRVVDDYNYNFERRFKETHGFFDFYQIDPATIAYGENYNSS